MNGNQLDEGKSQETAAPEAQPASAPEAPVAPPPQEEPISAGSALVGVIISPAETFRRLAERPWWLAFVPLVIMAVLSVASSWIFMSRVDMKQFVRDQIRQSGFASQMSESQIDEAAEKAAARPKWIQPAIGGVAMFVLALVLAAIFWLVLLAFGETLGFGKSFQATSWAFTPMILLSVVFLVLMFIKNPNDMDIQNPIFTNPAAFLDRDSIAKPLYALLQALDVFKIWVVALLGIGLAAAAKCKASKTIIAVSVLYAIWVVIRIALAAIF